MKLNEAPIAVQKQVLSKVLTLNREAGLQMMLLTLLILYYYSMSMKYHCTLLLIQTSGNSIFIQW